MKTFFLKPLLLIFCLSYLNTNAQTMYKIFGVIETGNATPISNASIQIIEVKKNFSADNDGRYQINLLPGKYTFLIHATGMDSLSSAIDVTTNAEINFTLKEHAQGLKEVVISSTSIARNLASVETGTEKMSMKSVNDIPLIFGERDIFKAIQLLPGIKSAGEGSSGVYIRGGSSDQNLILMDDVPVYNAGHLLGFFSTFNPDVVKDITVYKEGMPAQYGGRLSSILDVKTNQGNNSKFNAKGDIGLISSKLTFTGPLQKENSSFLISGRRTYIDAFLKLSPDKAVNQNALYFYDFNAKLDFQLNPNNKLVLSGYLGKDKLGLSDVFGINWGNNLASAQLKHLFSSKLSSSTTVAFTKYHNEINLTTSSESINLYSKINDVSFKHDFNFNLDSLHTVKFGISSIYHTVSPGELSVSGPANYNSVDYKDKFSLEHSAFISDNWKVNDKIDVYAGLRLVAFNALKENNYFNAEPRFTFNYLLNPNSAIKTSYEHNVQNMHMISNSASSRPTDKWLSSSEVIKPEIADQLSVGYYYNFPHLIEFSAEMYYKNMQNQIDYKDGANLFNSDLIEKELLFGRGKAYGVEFSLKKKAGDFTGWINYTLSRTERQINGINADQWYKARQDRTHDIAIVGMYKVNKKLNLSATWVYYTGDAITSPSGKYSLDDQAFFYYSKRNNYRMPNYHRLDFGANFNLKEKKNFSSDLSVGLYNAYNRQNVYSITFRESARDPRQIEAVKTILFQVLPSISYSFKFL